MSRRYDEARLLDKFRSTGCAINKESDPNDVAVSICLSEFVNVAGYIRVPVE